MKCGIVKKFGCTVFFSCVMIRSVIYDNYSNAQGLTDGKRGAMVSYISNEPYNRLKGSELLAGNLKPGEVDLSADQGDDRTGYPERYPPGRRAGAEHQ